ncbi:MAG TPA: hypothetical protein V6C82_09340 [Chroococcales cyanobacterium]|jgi:hypothetical protein
MLLGLKEIEKIKNSKIIPLALLLVFLAGCASPTVSSPTLSLGKTVASQIKGKDLQFLSVGVGELAAGRPQKNDKLVVFEASFERYSYGVRYGESRCGYKLWDRSGSWLLCENIYTGSSAWDQIDGPDPGRDFNPATLGWILNYGTFVRIEGAYHVSDSHLPPSVDVYFINGVPVRDLISK